MQHYMKLFEGPYEKIKEGKKKIEIRLFDEKRRKITVGDTIQFSKLPSLRENVTVKVLDLMPYETFRELINNTSLDDYGYPLEYDSEAFCESMYKIYTKEDERKYGVLGIRISLI